MVVVVHFARSVSELTVEHRLRVPVAVMIAAALQRRLRVCFGVRSYVVGNIGRRLFANCGGCETAMRSSFNQASANYRQRYATFSLSSTYLRCFDSTNVIVDVISSWSSTTVCGI